MATYVTSDIHGHLRALDRVLGVAQPGARDAVFVLGDMVDRGPDPLGVIECVRSLPNARVLMGNHESMLLESAYEDQGIGAMTWLMNGGHVTAEHLAALSRDARIDLMGWLAALPTFAVVEVADERPSARSGGRRMYVLCHAGIDACRLRASLSRAGLMPNEHGGYAELALDDMVHAMTQQDVDDLLWIRRQFWSEPTGLVGRDGAGPVVVAGHTPSILLGRYAKMMCAPGADGRARGAMVEVGASHDTGGAADRVCIDCSAAAGCPQGCVGVMRLEDGRVWLADIEEGE